MDQRQESEMQQEQKENVEAEVPRSPPLVEERIDGQNQIEVQAELQVEADAEQVVEMQEQKINQEVNNQNIAVEDGGQNNDNNQQMSSESDVQMQQQQSSSHQEPLQQRPNLQDEPQQQQQIQQENEQNQINQPDELNKQVAQEKQNSNKQLQIPQIPQISQIQQIPQIPQIPCQHQQFQQAQPNQQQIQEIKQAQSFVQKQAQLLEQKRLQQIAHAHANQMALQQKKAQQNEAYINKLEKLIQNLRDSLAKSKSQQSTLRLSNKGLSLQVSNSKQNALELRKRKMELQTEKFKLTKEVDKLQKQNVDYKNKLAEIQKIGNILVLQNSLQQLKLLTTSQNEEIQQLKTANQQQSHSYYQQQFNLLQSYQTELTYTKQQLELLNLQIEQLKDQITQLHNDKSTTQLKNGSLSETITSLQQQNQNLQNQIGAWHKKWESVEEQRSQYKKSKQLDQKVSQYESQRFLGQDNDVQIISTLTDKEQKNLLLKEYLKLQTLYEESKIKQQQAQISLKRAIRDSKIKQANVIRKKDYQDLLAKYKKAKNCLEGAFQKIKKLQSSESNLADIRQEVNQLLQGNQSRLCQTVIKHTNEQVKNINQKINQMQLNQEIIELRKQNNHLKSNHSRLQKQLKNNQKILYLMNDQIQVKKKVIEQKSKIIQKFIQNGYHHQNEHFRQRISKLQRQVSNLNGNLSIYEVKNLLLIQQNQSFLHQMSHWKNLYNNIKQKLSQRINVSLLQSQKPILQNKMEVQSFYCKQCEKRNLIFTNQIERSQAATQTQNLNDFHYKEIKQSLMCLKKIINKEIDTIPDSHQKTVKIITQFKEKYEKYIQKYNAKLLQLKKQKSQNQAWRAKAKQQIREQFQQIRDLIGTSRLTTALRQAKSLIDYLQNEQQKGQQEQKSQNGREQGQEQNNEGQQK